uniref:OTU domain-containing protein n=1 Tax=Panagrolaimus sp. PS1159 TaxID=55785 RepID=A0AC35GRZ0_9BILA
MTSNIEKEMRRTFCRPEEECLREKCELHGLKFFRQYYQGFYFYSDITYAKIDRTSNIIGDGNCEFRALFLILTRKQDQHGKIRQIVMDEILSNKRYSIYHENA